MGTILHRKTANLEKEMKERQCFECDEDGHWYLIPVSDKKEFDRLLYDEDDDYEKFNDKFYCCMLNMHISGYSFVDCKPIT